MLRYLSGRTGADSGGQGDGGIVELRRRRGLGAVSAGGGFAGRKKVNEQHDSQQGVSDPRIPTVPGSGAGGGSYGPGLV